MFCHKRQQEKEHRMKVESAERVALVFSLLFLLILVPSGERPPVDSQCPSLVRHCASCLPRLFFSFLFFRLRHRLPFERKTGCVSKGCNLRLRALESTSCWSYGRILVAKSSSAGQGIQVFTCLLTRTFRWAASSEYMTRENGKRTRRDPVTPAVCSDDMLSGQRKMMVTEMSFSYFGRRSGQTGRTHHTRWSHVTVSTRLTRCSGWSDWTHRSLFSGRTSVTLQSSAGQYKRQMALFGE